MLHRCIERIDTLAEHCFQFLGANLERPVEMCRALGDRVLKLGKIMICTGNDGTQTLLLAIQTVKQVRNILDQLVADIRE